jgi:hypothetical protein
MFKKHSHRLLGCLVSIVLLVGQANAANLKKRHSIDLSLGFYGSANTETLISTPGVNVAVFNDKFTGRIAYSYFLNDNLALHFSLGILQPKIRLTTQSIETGSIIPVLLGIKYYPLKISESRFKPYLLSAAGTAIGSASGAGLYYAKARTESAFMFYLGLGGDVELGSFVKLTSGIGYNFSTDFSEPLGGRKNYSGAEIFFGFGFMF